MIFRVGIILLVATTSLALPVDDERAQQEDPVLAVFKHADVTNQVQEHVHTAPTGCAPASASGCLEHGKKDNDCCAPKGSAACAEGFTGGQTDHVCFAGGGGWAKAYTTCCKSEPVEPPAPEPTAPEPVEPVEAAGPKKWLLTNDAYSAERTCVSGPASLMEAKYGAKPAGSSAVCEKGSTNHYCDGECPLKTYYDFCCPPKYRLYVREETSTSADGLTHAEYDVASTRCKKIRSDGRCRDFHGDPASPPVATPAPPPANNDPCEGCPQCDGNNGLSYSGSPPSTSQCNNCREANWIKRFGMSRCWNLAPSEWILRRTQNGKYFCCNGWESKPKWIDANGYHDDINKDEYCKKNMQICIEKCDKDWTGDSNEAHSTSQVKYCKALVRLGQRTSDVGGTPTNAPTPSRPPAPLWHRFGR